MAFFYVDSTVGTRTTGGGFGSQQTGSFSALGASNVYASITDALNDTAFAAGDTIFVSTDHNASASSILYPFPDGDAGTFVCCVDAANCDQSAVSTTALETATTGDIVWTGGGRRLVRWYGVCLQCGDDFRFGYDVNTLIFEDCKFIVPGPGDLFSLPQESNDMYLINCNIDFKNANAHLSIGSNRLFMYGGSITGVAGQILFDAGQIGNTGGAGISMARFVGVDLSDIETLTNSNGIEGGRAVLELINCNMNASVTRESGLTPRGIVIKETQSDTQGEYRFLYQEGQETVEEDTQIFRNETAAFPGGEQISLKCVTTSNVTKNNPLVFEFPSRFVELSSAASDVVTIHLATTSTLHDDDVWVEFIYPDGTTYQQGNAITTHNAERAQTSTTELTTDSGSDWRDGASALSGYNEYKIDLDTSGDVGSDAYPFIRLFVGVAATIYFCPTLSVS